MSSSNAFFSRLARALPWLLTGVAVLVTIALLDLKGISTDEGFRLGIINGGKPAAVHPGPPWATWADVFAAVRPHAYQPAYYFFQNTLMRLAERQDLAFFRLVNVGFFVAALSGLLVLSRSWSVWPRCFLLGLFAFNAYLFMHVLQIREYIAGVALYIWSTWLVLKLDRRTLAHEWADFAWFAGYGLLLALGFYLQTWTVFPAAAQGAFLLLRRRPQFWRYAAHLALSCLVAFCLTWPYLHDNQQKVNIGLWAREQVTLPGQLAQGFQLVLSGHLPGHDRFTAVLPWAWLVLLLAGGWILFRGRTTDTVIAADRRQAWLMSLCIGVAVSFQAIYFYKVEPLSVWPRYFIIHYFFLTWLIALAFRALYRIPHWSARLVLVAATLLLATSAVYQVRSYYRDPYFDTSLSRTFDWRVGSDLLATVLTSDDVVLCQDFVTRSTLTFTRPLPNRLLTFEELPNAALAATHRIIYLEAGHLQPARGELATRLAALGFSAPVELAVATSESIAPPYWRVIAFSRP